MKGNFGFESRTGIESIDNCGIRHISVEISLKRNYYSEHYFILKCGEIPERPKGTDCKSVGSAFVGSNPTLATSLRLARLGFEV